MQTLNAYLRRAARRCLTPLAARAAGAYIAGPELDDAIKLSQELTARGFASTLGYWDGEDDSPDIVAAQYHDALEAICRLDDSYLSIKFPALGNSCAKLDAILAFARQRQQRVHFDSLAPEHADAMWSAATAAARQGEARISCSLPGRWRRSLADAVAAIAAGIVPRIVKGQWPDPVAPDIDLRQGFLEVVDSLAGRVPQVTIASHDAPLVDEAIRRLRAAGTACELELLYGLPHRAPLAFATRERVPVRLYVPYGKAYLPYCLAQARRQPRLFWWLLRDAFTCRN